MGRVHGWDAAVRAIQTALAKQRGQQGAGLRLLTETITSPTLAHQIGLLLKRFPGAKWHQYEPINRDSIREGARRAFGQDINSYYRFDRADVVLALDADFLACGPGHLRYVRQFTAKRRLRTGPAKNAAPTMNRLYVVETTPAPKRTTAGRCGPGRSKLSRGRWRRGWTTN